MRFSYWGVFWIDASSKDAAESGYAELGRQAGRGPTFGAGKFWLSECERPWLLILDNADDEAWDIADLFPTGNTGHILISTRRHSLEIHATVEPVYLAGMLPEEAMDLLLRSAYPGNKLHDVQDHQRSLAAGIAARLGYLAIALDHAGATIRRKIYTIEEYLHSYLGHREYLSQLFRNMYSSEIDIVTTWDIPFRRIEARQTPAHQDAVSLLHVVAFLHFDAISKEMLSAAWHEGTVDFTYTTPTPNFLLTVPSSCDEGESRLRQAIGILADYSIIQYNESFSQCSLHPVVHAWARSRITDDEKYLYWLRCAVYLLARCCATGLILSKADHRAALVPHIGTCLDLIEIKNPCFFQELEGTEYLECFAALYEANGAWNKSLALLRSILSCREKVLGKWHHATLKTKRDISRNLWNLFEIREAIDVQRKVLEIHWWKRPSLTDWCRPLKPEHLDYCTTLDDLTQSLWLAGYRDLSVQVGKRAVNGLLKRLGANDARTWNAMFNLGRAFLHSKQLSEAHRLLVFVTRKRKKSLGMRHPDTLMVRNELGMCLLSKGDRLPVAESLIRNVLTARKAVLGLEHAYTLWSENDLSKVLCERGQATNAVKLLEQIVPVVQRTLGEAHVGMHMTKSNLARSYARSGRWAKAEITLAELLEFTNEAHPNWFRIMSGYVYVLMQMKHYDEAELTCLKLYRKLKGDGSNPMQVKLAAQMLAKVYLCQDQLEKLSKLQLQHPTINPELPIDIGNIL